ncbi:unnamed protein product, partial [Closterium sp. NIES-53]
SHGGIESLKIAEAMSKFFNKPNSDDATNASGGVLLPGEVSEYVDESARADKVDAADSAEADGFDAEWMEAAEQALAAAEAAASAAVAAAGRTAVTGGNEDVSATAAASAGASAAPSVAVAASCTAVFVGAANLQQGREDGEGTRREAMPLPPIVPLPKSMPPPNNASPRHPIKKFNKSAAEPFPATSANGSDMSSHRHATSSAHGMSPHTPAVPAFGPITSRQMSPVTPPSMCVSSPATTLQHMPPVPPRHHCAAPSVGSRFTTLVSDSTPTHARHAAATPEQQCIRQAGALQEHVPPPSAPQQATPAVGFQRATPATPTPYRAFPPNLAPASSVQAAPVAAGSAAASSVCGSYTSGGYVAGSRGLLDARSACTDASAAGISLEGQGAWALRRHLGSDLGPGCRLFETPEKEPGGSRAYSTSRAEVAAGDDGEGQVGKCTGICPSVQPVQAEGMAEVAAAAAGAAAAALAAPEEATAAAEATAAREATTEAAAAESALGSLGWRVVKPRLDSDGRTGVGETSMREYGEAMGHVKVGGEWGEGKGCLDRDSEDVGGGEGGGAAGNVVVAEAGAAGEVRDAGNVAAGVKETKAAPTAIAARKVEAVAQVVAEVAAAVCVSEEEPYLARLNAEQRAAAAADVDRPLLVLAGPGSGKTSTMVARILHLLHVGVPSNRILAMTFTTAAANEMRERVLASQGRRSAGKKTGGAGKGRRESKGGARSMVDKEGKEEEEEKGGKEGKEGKEEEGEEGVTGEVAVSTFHSLCLQLAFGAAAAGAGTAGVGGAGRWGEKGNKENEEGKGGGKLGESVEERVGREVQDLKKSRAAAAKWVKFVVRARVLRAYASVLEKCNAVDYHDFILLSTMLLTKHSDVLQECMAAWTHVLVDEFQDTSRIQFAFVKALCGTHGRITVVGDDDQSIFSFNGANAASFDMFREQFLDHTEVRLCRNYRSTGTIVRASAAVISQNFPGRRAAKELCTDNSDGEKIRVVEVRNEAAQCALVADAIMSFMHQMHRVQPHSTTATTTTTTSAITNTAGNPVGTVSGSSSAAGSAAGSTAEGTVAGNTAAAGAAAAGVPLAWSDVAVLYRRQVTGRAFQAAMRERKIPFNVHGVAFYRKKALRNVLALLRLSLPALVDNTAARRVWKLLFSREKDEAKKAADHVEQRARDRGCSFLEAAETIFSGKVSGRFTRKQLKSGAAVLTTIRIARNLLKTEVSLTAFVDSIIKLIPERAAFSSRATVSETSGKLLNEDDDMRTARQFLIDDISAFLSLHSSKPPDTVANDETTCRNTSAADAATSCFPTSVFSSSSLFSPSSSSSSCAALLRAFLDYVAAREAQNNAVRRKENEDSVTLTTMHQSKGLEWHTVFIVSANEGETPLQNRFEEERGGGVERGSAGRASGEGSEEEPLSLEEERRLFYVAMTRARHRLVIVTLRQTPEKQVLQPSRFIREIPSDLLLWQGSAPITAPVASLASAQPRTPAASYPDGGNEQRGAGVATQNLGPGVVIGVGEGEGMQEEEEGEEEGGEGEGGEGEGEMKGVGGGEEETLTTSHFTHPHPTPSFPTDHRASIAAIFHSWKLGLAFQQSVTSSCSPPPLPQLPHGPPSENSSNLPLVGPPPCLPASPLSLCFPNHFYCNLSLISSSFPLAQLLPLLDPPPSFSRPAFQHHCSRHLVFLSPLTPCPSFPTDHRASIAAIFHSWARRPAFQQPSRLLAKVRAVVDSRQSSGAARSASGKEALRLLRPLLSSTQAASFAAHVIAWAQLPFEQRALHRVERQVGGWNHTA